MQTKTVVMLGETYSGDNDMVCEGGGEFSLPQGGYTGTNTRIFHGGSRFMVTRAPLQYRKNIFSHLLSKLFQSQDAEKICSETFHSDRDSFPGASFISLIEAAVLRLSCAGSS